MSKMAVFLRAKGVAGVISPDVCVVPLDVPVPTPYPDGTLISVSKQDSVRKVYSVKGGRARELTIRDGQTAPTFIILDDDNVSVYKHECRTPDAAKRAVASVIGANASAIVISIDDEEESPSAFHVTPRSTRSLRIPVRQRP